MIMGTIADEAKRAIEVMRKGGVILYPTDTVWGIGCDATNEEAVKLFLQGEIKFLQIAELVEKAISAQNNINAFTVDDIFAADKAARELVRGSI